MPKTICVRRGFSLTEVAIVLGVVGLVLGAVWEAAAQVYHIKRLNNVEQQLTVVIDNAKKLYANQFGDPNFFVNDISTEISAGMYPPDFFKPYTTYTYSWGGNTYTYMWPIKLAILDYYYQGYATNLDNWYGVGGTTPIYVVNLWGKLSVDDCTRLIAFFSGLDVVRNIMTDVNGWGPDVGPWYGTGSTMPKPIPLSQISQACQPQWFGYNSIYMDFSLN